MSDPDRIEREREAFDQLTPEEQDAFLLAIGLAMVECAVDELDRSDAAAAAASAETTRKAG